MIDLSFLTEEEQETIRAVLTRDAELKKAEEQRIQNLQKTVGDKDQLRYLTGEWFYETKQLRHQDRIHGSDIIRASMRHTYKPLTILELSQILPEKPSFVRSENKEVFVPPVLCGLLQEPHMQLGHERNQNKNPYETPQETHKPVLLSPTKQRKNPFNEFIAPHTSEEKDSQLLDGAADQTHTPNKESLPSSDSCVSYATNLKPDPNDSPATQNTSVSMTVPEKQAVCSSSQDCFIEVDGPADRQINSAALRGILKRLSTSSSTDSLITHLDLQSPVSLDSPTDTWIDKKQVRFSSTVGRSRVEWQDGKELGEHSLLDDDSIAPSEMENNSNLENDASTHGPLLQRGQMESQEVELSYKNLQMQDADQQQVLGDLSEHCEHAELLSPPLSGPVSDVQQSGKPVHLETQPKDDRHSQATVTDRIHQQKLPEQSTDMSVEATSEAKSSANGSTKSSCHSVSPKPRQRLLGFFRRDKDKNAQVQSPQKEQLTISKKKEPENTSNLSKDAADMTMDKLASVKQKAKTPEMTEVRTLQLTALQNTPFEEIMTSVDLDAQQETQKQKVVQFPERPSNLEASWERENNSNKLISTNIKEQARHEDIAKTGTEASHGPQNVQTDSAVEGRNNNLSHQMEMTVSDSAARSLQVVSSAQTECSILVNLSKEDGTYRANPVLIYEETDDSLTGSVTESPTLEPQENVITPVFSLACHKQKQEGDIQEEGPANVTELKHFWEKEYTGPKVIMARVKETSGSSILNNKVVSPQSDLRTSLESREKSEEEAQMSPNVSKSLKVMDKGFVCPDKSQLWSSGSDGDIQSACQSHQVMAECQERPLSPSKSKTPRSKEQEDEVRRSPSKTCHPRVLPRESSSPKGSRLEGSPLKTFPIDINPQSKVTEEQLGKPTPAPRQRKSPSHKAKQTDTNSLPLDPQDKEVYFGNIKTQQHSSGSSTALQFKIASEKKSGTFTSLARSFIPQDFQHYLGPHEKAHVPPFHQDKAAQAAETDAVHTPLRDYVGNQSDGSLEENLSTTSSWTVQNKVRNSSQDTTTRVWSLSRASSGSYDDNSSPVMSALKRLSSRTISSSKSLENLTSQTTSSLSNSKQMKSDVSVPVLQQDETDSDSTFENTLGWRRNTGSSMSNISLSSGMASMSSVSGSMSSIYPADFGDIEVQGSIQFAVNYIQKLGEFHIFVVHCRDLAVADTKRSRSDPYVKCYLLPDKIKLGKRKTSVKKKTVNPNYNEILRFKLIMEVLKTQSLNISVWHNNTFGRNMFLGEVDLDLSEWNFSNTQINEFALKARVSAQTSTHSPSCLLESRGQMRVAMRFLPQTSHSKRTSRMETGEVQIWVKDCKNLPPVRGVIIDPFVKCTVLPDTSQKNRQKTRVVKRTANPMFNHTMVYDGFRPEDLREACVEITVWDHDRLNNHYIGGLRLGLGTGQSYGMEVVWMDSTTDEADLWRRMLQSDGEWVEDVLPLRMLVMAKSMSK
ncbi:hypothetical protein PAMP_007550 [Pampus punctatissimus]